MIGLKTFFIRCFATLCSLPLFSNSGQIAKVNDKEIWYETFGEKKDRALLLIMGALCQGILWPTEFCEKLAKEGFYVIRYDHRDSGFSTCGDFEKEPYDLLDMAKDGVGLLNYLKIDKAHICGLSMGGPLAELMAVHFEDRVETITLMATSPDFRPSSLGYDGLYPKDIALSRPKDVYLVWMQRFLKTPPQTFEEQLDGRVECWSILNGSVVPFEEERYREIHHEFLSRLKHPESLTNHLSAIKRSFDMIQTIPSMVKVPTLIIHGSEDPIFPPDHCDALSKLIPHAKYLFVEGLGHVLNCHFYDLIIKEIKHHSKLGLKSKHMSEKDSLLQSVMLGRLEFFHSLSSSPLPGSHFKKLDKETFLYVSGINYAPANGIIQDNEKGNPSDAEIQKAITFFNARKLPFIWWTGSKNLEDKGFQFGGILTGIAVDISKGVTQTKASSKIKVKVVESKEDVNTFTEIAVKASGMNDECIQEFQIVNLTGSQNGELVHFLAYLNDIPIGTASLATCSKSAGIWNLATLPEYRKHGVATTLVEAALVEAAKRKYSHVMAILMPKGMAWGLFTKLGFQEVCRFPFYIYGASPEDLEKQE